MRKLSLTLALVSLPSLAAAQQWPSVSGQITVQTAPPPPPPQQPMYVQQQPQPQYAPPPPPPVYAQGYPQPMQLQQPRLNYNMVYGPEPMSSGARVQLVVGQAVNGMALGITLAGAFGAERPAIFSGSMLLGGGIGAVGALLASRDGVTAGQAAAINNGTIFGGLAATFTLLGLSNGSLSERAAFGVVAGGLALGTGAGIAWASQTPLGGRVEFASSMGLWSAFVGAHLYLATRGYGTWDDRTSTSEFAVLGWSSLGLMAAGLTAGVLLSPNVPVSAARMRWINLAGVGGWGIIGLSSLLLASDGSSNDALMAYSIGSIAGLGGGLVLGYFLTQNTDTYWERMHETARRTGPTLNVAPGGPGGSPGVSLVGTF
jgi:hypothetical protein